MSQRYLGGMIYNPPAGYSGYFDGTTGLNDTGGGIIGTSTSTFTVEAWINMSAAPAGSAQHGSLVGLDANFTTTTNYLSFGPDTSQKLRLFWFSGSDNSCTGSTTLALGTWYHIALVVNSNAITMYVNGVAETLSGTTTLSNRPGSSGQFNIGKNGQAQFKGYASNVRISNTARTISLPSGPYNTDANTLVLACNAATLVSPAQGTSAITWETNTGVASTQNPFPLSQPVLNPALGGAGNGIFTLSQYQQLKSQGLWPAIDPYFRNTTLMLHGNGTNGGQNNTFLDSSTNNFSITRNGNTTQGTFSPYGNNWSVYFGGDGNYLSIPASSNFAFGTGDFTVECWVMVMASGGNQCLIDFRVSGNTSQMFLKTTSTTDFELRIGGSQVHTFTAPPSQWNHIAITRSSGTIRSFVNGSIAATTSNSADLTSTGPLLLNRFYDAAIGSTNYLSNVRVVKGTALYTSAFTPSTSPLTAISNTSYLGCQSNRFIDNSSAAATVTPTGSATTIQRFSPFAPTIPYDASWAGGSGYFDGSGDYLRVANGSFLTFTGDFTIEGWVYSSFTGGTGGQGFTLIDTRTVYDSVNWAFGIYTYGPFVNNPQFNFGGGSLQSSINCTPNAWNHVALSRSGSTLRIFVNGVQGYSGTVSGTINTGSNANATIGAGFDGAQYMSPGYCAGLRVVNGTAVYTSAFTPPAAPLSAITNTSLLLSMTNGSIVDNAMMGTLETIANTQISTGTKKYGTGSIAFDGTGDYVAIPYSQNFNLGSGDFTVECWANISYVQYTAIITSTNTSISTGMWLLGFSNTANQMSFGIDSGGNAIVGADYSNYVNKWTHIAACRSGSTLRLFFNGVQVASTTNTTSFAGDSSNPVYMGRRYTNSAQYDLNGYIDDLRITKGAARYVSAFTPPTSQVQDM